MKRLGTWTMTKEGIEDVNIAAHFLTIIGKKAYNLLETSISRKAYSTSLCNSQGTTTRPCKVYKFQML